MIFYATVCLNTLHKNMQKLQKQFMSQLRTANFTSSRAAAKRPLIAALASVFVIAIVGTVVVPRIYAETLQAQIEQLQAENNRDQSTVNVLLLEAKSFEDAIAKLQGKITLVQQNIATNQARQVDLQQQITAKQVQLDAQRKILGEDIKAMYVEGQLSTIEMLATSKDLNDFVDTSTYRQKVQSKIQQTLSEIAKLQNQLQEQKHEVETLLAAQRIQQNQLSQDRAKQAELLSYNSNQRNAFNSKIAANQDKIHELQVRQAALNQQGATKVSISGNERGGACDAGSGNGGYRLASAAGGDVCDAPKDSILDWAGIENRECTSYAYWYFKRVAGNTDFTASGDAKYWVTTSNYPVHNLPQVGAIGVKTEGQWGHVTIVQAVGPTTYKGVSVPAGQVLTSEMNSDFTGKFAYNLRGAGSMSYIYK
jgi:peptidoglycan hydrolase CwlO-like protein